MRRVLQVLVRFYQRYLSPIQLSKCRYYPTCSNYLLWQIETNPNLLHTIASSLLRILRCNQLFDGGIDYPRRRLAIKPSPLHPQGGIHSIRFWYIPDGDHYIIVKSL